jgi:hypothetical protein
LTDEPVLDWLNNPSKKSDVSNLLKTFEKYRESHQNSNKKPEDYSAVGKSIKELKKAEKAFDIDKDGLYGSGKAKNAEKKIDKWIRENSNNPQGILKALDFRLQRPFWPLFFVVVKNSEGLLVRLRVITRNEKRPH